MGKIEVGSPRQRLRKKDSKLKLLPSKSLQDHFHDYCMSTSIHGVKYLGETGRPFWERLWWLLIFTASILGSAHLINKVWNKWDNSPVIVSFAETTTPVWQVPFPSVTICSETKSRASVFDYTDAMNTTFYMTNSTDPDIIRHAADVSLFCDPHEIIDNSENFTDESTYNFLKNVTVQLEETILACRWEGVMTINCSQYFKPVITEEGFCFTFNVLDAKDMFRSSGQMRPYPNDSGQNNTWSLEHGYLPDTPLETYPRRALDAGAPAGIFILLKSLRKDFDYRCRGPIQGYKILLHNPAEIPSVGERYFRAPINQEVLVAVSPDIMTTSMALRSYVPERRQCYFPSERFLKYFQVYTQRNCELECLTNFTLHHCSCVAIHMPRFENDTICGGGKKQCMNDARCKFCNSLNPFDCPSILLRKKEIQISHAGKKEGSCDCLPACASLQYEAEISQADFNWEQVIAAYNDNDTNEGSTFSRVTIFFKDMQFVTSRRSELFGPVDFLANCGGLLGLFSGFSLLSFVEIIYYITLRLWGNLKQQRERERADKELRERVIVAAALEMADPSNDGFEPEAKEKYPFPVNPTSFDAEHY